MSHTATKRILGICSEASSSTCPCAPAPMSATRTSLEARLAARMGFTPRARPAPAAAAVVASRKSRRSMESFDWGAIRSASDMGTFLTEKWVNTRLFDCRRFRQWDSWDMLQRYLQNSGESGERYGSLAVAAQ